MIAIDGLNIKTYVHSSKACSITARGCVLKAKDSSIHLAFDGINVNKCIVKLKRPPGSDGIVIINNATHTIPPNAEIGIEVKSSVLNIKRAPRPLGNILLTGVTVDESSQEQAVVMSCDWNAFLKKSRKVKGIKLTDNGLFASEYAQIIGHPNVRKIETDPPNASVTNKDTIKFLYPCRIINIEFDDDPAAPAMDSQFVQEIASKVGHQAQYNENSEDVGPVVDAKNYVKPPEVKSPVCVFTLNNFNIQTLNKTAHIKQVGSAVRLNRMGTFEIPISSLEPYQEYTIILKLSRVDGNGKTTISLGTTAGTIREDKVILAPHRTNEMFVSFGTDKHPEFNASYCIKISRPPAASGAILVQSIRIMGNNEVKPPVPQQYISLIQAPIPDAFRSDETFNVTEAWYDYKSVNLERNIQEMSRHFSVLAPEKYTAKPVLNVAAVIRLTNYNSRVWFNRMSPGFAGLEFVYHTIAYHGKRATNKNANISLCSIDFLTPNPRILLDSIPNYRKLSKENVAVLQRTKQILTPSLTNMYQLKEKLPNNQIEVCALPWVYIDGKYTRKNQSVYFEEDVRLTAQLLRAWDPKFGKLYIVGSNLVLPKWATHVSLLTPYPELLKLVLESQRLIYLSCNFHHQSGLIDLAMDSGMTVISNNHNYISKSVPIRNDIISGMPADQSIRSALDKKVNEFGFAINVAEYNSKVMKLMKKIVGVA